ncbi:BrnA antitoxin family protein [Bauldia litoralis]|uniref:Uncharacterized conserved protein, DUF4415 family n=1 Tax=Bauldia litoralis TaxID=665467 RepID=A0A1G6CEQ4_9HYPH|nr:BrnA antitoxin family protein [Bauldia litoralis]SDB31360.1 Uncharacterized conserved protein, DUF4415 family [Bauldia litoralis]
MSGNKKGIGSDLRSVDAHAIRPEEYDEAPELTDEQLARAEVREAGKVVRRGRPRLDRPKEAVKIRLSQDVLEHFRAGGPGWQTRINESLERTVARQRKAHRR